MSRKNAKHIAVVAERTNGFSRNVIEGVADFAASKENWTLDLIDPPGIAISDLDSFDGFITRLPDVRTAERLIKLGRPVVETADVIDPEITRQFVNTISDNMAISRLVAAHFTSLHHTNFAFCGFDGRHYSQVLCRAFSDALREKGLKVSVYKASKSVRTHFRHASQYTSPLDIPDSDTLADWLKSLPNPTALFCCNDRRAFQVIKLCHKIGIKIPQDISICGVDNDLVICTFLSPRLSSVDPDARRVGRKAASVMAGLLGEPGYAFHKQGSVIMTPPKGFVTRTSSAIYPIDPPWLSDALLFIRQHTCDHLTASDVCAFVGKSNGVMNAVLRKALKTTIQKEIAAARLEAAKSLLISEDLPIQDIALRAGFASHEYFCRCFASSVGTSPTAYRENRGNVGGAYQPLPSVKSM